MPHATTGEYIVGGTVVEDVAHPFGVEVGEGITRRYRIETLVWMLPGGTWYLNTNNRAEIDLTAGQLERLHRALLGSGRAQVFPVEYEISNTDSGPIIVLFGEVEPPRPLMG